MMGKNVKVDPPVVDSTDGARSEGDDQIKNRRAVREALRRELLEHDLARDGGVQRLRLEGDSRLARTEAEQLMTALGRQRDLSDASRRRRMAVFETFQQELARMREFLEQPLPK